MKLKKGKNIVAGAHDDTLKIGDGNDTIVEPLTMTSTSLQADVTSSQAQVITTFIIGNIP